VRPRTSYDAVLLLGPLYHLTSREERITALREARRVTRSGGLVIAEALSRFYPIFEALAAGRRPDPDWPGDTTRFLADGQYRNPGDDPAHFTISYFHRPEELPGEIQDAGLILHELVAVSGNVKLMPDLAERLDAAESRDRLLSVLRLVEAGPSLLGMSQNFVAISRVR
jgi:SAM-dependent methyltransferase